MDHNYDRTSAGNLFILSDSGFKVGRIPPGDRGRKTSAKTPKQCDGLVMGQRIQNYDTLRGDPAWRKEDLLANKHVDNYWRDTSKHAEEGPNGVTILSSHGC